MGEGRSRMHVRSRSMHEPQPLGAMVQALGRARKGACSRSKGLTSARFPGCRVRACRPRTSMCTRGRGDSTRGTGHGARGQARHVKRMRRWGARGRRAPGALPDGPSRRPRPAWAVVPVPARCERPRSRRPRWRKPRSDSVASYECRPCRGVGAVRAAAGHGAQGGCKRLQGGCDSSEARGSVGA
jgi:hypothetical protein